MPHVDGSAILERLRTAWSYEDQNLALRALKNDTVGQILRKEKWVELGVLRPVVKVITARRPNGWASSGRQDSHKAPVAPLPNNLPQEDLARLQALELLGIFAGGGPSFLPPLHAAGAVPAILSCLDPTTTHPRLVKAALQSIVTITKAAVLTTSTPTSPSPITIATLANALFAAPYVNALQSIFALDAQVFWAVSMTNAACSLVSILCREERHQIALAKAGILDALTVKVASYVVAQGQVVPGADVAAEKEGLRDAIPQPASANMDLAAVMDAVSAIMGDSRLRACMVLYSPSILAIFPHLEFEGSANDLQAAWKALINGGLSNAQPPSLGALDMLLPPIPSQQSRAYYTQSAPFPPLGMALSRDNLASFGRGARNRRSQGGSSAQEAGWASTARSVPLVGAPASELEGEEAESPMIPWLINLVRSTAGLERLAAASVLTSLYKAGFSSRTREAAMALLVVPLLLRMLDDASSATGESSSSLSANGALSIMGQAGTANADNVIAEQRAMTENALIVLARLVANSDILQKAAVDCNAIKILSRLLKESYEPVSQRLTARPWNPTPTVPASNPDDDMEDKDDDEDVDEGDSDSDITGVSTTRCSRAAATRLGPAGLSTLLACRIRLREVTLKALTSLVASKYEYQKMFVEQEVMPCLVASLKPTPSKPRGGPVKDKAKAGGQGETSGDGGSPSDDTEDEVDPEYGRNPVGVLVAACNCVRMLSRSIAILRTTLEDAGVAMPIFKLLQHPELEVQIAATGVVCNLVTETSPMRQQYAEKGIMSVLCNHAHSLNSPLRLNALWALKHFVDGVDTDMKKACLEQLGSGWLVQLIDPDSGDDTHLFAAQSPYNSSAPVGMPTAAGGGGMDSDVEMDQLDEDEEETEKSAGKMPWTGGPVAAPAAMTPSSTAQATPTTAASPVSSSLQRANFPRMSHERSRTGRLRHAEAKLAAIRDMEVTTLHKNRNDDIVIQEQGLNFIRNLIGPKVSGPSAIDPVAEVSDMIDYLFNEIGQDRLFQILLSKLKVKVLHPFERRQTNNSSNNGGPVGSTANAGGAGGGVARVLHPQVKIIEAVLFILVHISASAPRHRQMVIAQTELLKALVGQFNSHDKGVRVALCHLLTNLTWVDDASDTQAASTRTHELKRLGLLTKLKVLQIEDMELDVREQAKMAIHQMGGGGTGNGAVGHSATAVAGGGGGSGSTLDSI